METQISTHAHRQLKKLPQDVRREILDALREFRNWPDVRNVKSLKNRPDYRLRVGRYRVIFEVTANVIWITEIALRNEGTY